MTRTLPKKSRPSWDIEDLSLYGVIYVLVPGLIFGGLAEGAKDGLTVGSVLLSVFLGIGGFFIAATHLFVAAKVGAKFLIPVIGAISALVGLIFLGYGISLLLEA